MQTDACVLLCLSFLNLSLAARPIELRAGRELRQTVSPCLASGGRNVVTSVSSSLRVVGPGTVSLVVRSASAAEQTLRNDVTEIVELFIDEAEGEADAGATTNRTATAIAKAFAAAFGSSVVDIVSDAAGASVCVDAFTSAEASTKAFAQILVEVLVESSNKIAFSDNRLAVNALSAATAAALTKTRLSVCGQGAFDVTAIVDEAATILVEPFVELFAAVVAVLQNDLAGAVLELDIQNDVLVATTKNSFSATTVRSGNATVDVDSDSVACFNEAGVCPDVFSSCCAAEAATCQCGLECTAKGVLIGSGDTVPGFELILGSTNGLGSGDTCLCP